MSCVNETVRKLTCLSTILSNGIVGVNMIRTSHRGSQH